MDFTDEKNIVMGPGLRRKNIVIAPGPRRQHRASTLKKRRRKFYQDDEKVTIVLMTPISIHPRSNYQHRYQFPLVSRTMTFSVLVSIALN